MHPPDPTRRGELQGRGCTACCRGGGAGRGRTYLCWCSTSCSRPRPSRPPAPPLCRPRLCAGSWRALGPPRAARLGEAWHTWRASPLSLFRPRNPLVRALFLSCCRKAFRPGGGKRRWAVNLRPPAQGRAVRGDGHRTWGGGFPAAPGAPRPPNRFSQPRLALGLGGHPLLGFGWGQQFQHRTGTCQADHRPLTKEGHSQRHGTRGRCVPPPHPRRPGQHGRVPSDPDPLPGQQLLPGIACLWASKTSYQGPGDFVSGDQVVQA